MEDKDNRVLKAKYTHVNISDILSRFRCEKCNIKCNEIVYETGYICDSCRKIDNRDFIINEILS